MHTLRTLCERVAPVGPQTTLEDACARFDAEPGLRLLPVLSEGRPLGLLTRGSALAARGIVARVAGLLAGPPPVHEADEQALSVARSLGGREAARAIEGFIVVDAGEYLGVADGTTLLEGAVGAADAARSLLQSAHREISVPLGGLLAVAGLMLRQPLSLDAAAQLRAMINAAESALAFSGELLACVEDGATARPTPETVALRELLDHLDALWHVRAGAKGVRLITSLRGDPDLLVSLDAARFRQVLNALVAEAVEGGSGGVVEVRLSAERDGPGVRLQAQVRDAHTTPVRASAETASFAQSRRDAVVDALGGRLWREQNPGAGATVVFELCAPLARSPAEISRAETAGPRRTLGHILVVDDNATNRLVAEALCDGFGFSSEAVENGLEAVDAVRLRAFDLVLMDIRMPGMDGVEATRAIRALPGPARQLPIVALTANADPEAVEGYRAAGMAGVVEKPIKPEALFAALSAILQPSADQAVEAA